MLEQKEVAVEKAGWLDLKIAEGVDLQGHDKAEGIKGRLPSPSGALPQEFMSDEGWHPLSCDRYG